jgi:hypothetical protein
MKQRPHDPLSAFHLDLTAPSIFRSDVRFTPSSKTGLTVSQTASVAVSAAIAATGRSPGSIVDLSAKGNDLIEQGMSRRIAGGGR